MLRIHADDFAPFPFANEIARLIDEGREAILIVPEQLALSAEKALAARLPSCAPLYFEVSNFSRLADRVFRTLGGISAPYTDAAADIILMWKTLDALSPFLTSPRSGATDTVKEGLSLLAEITAAGISSKTLRETAARLPLGSALGGKLTDLALLTDVFAGERDAAYGSLARDLDRLPPLLAERSDEGKTVFADTEIFVSGFTSFTEPEARVLGELMRHGRLTVALPLPTGEEASLAYEEVLATRDRLLALAEEVGTPCEATEESSSDRPPMLAYAKKMLFCKDGREEAYAGEDDGSLTLVKAKDAYAAAAAVAARIAEAVQKGARYRDFTVVTRSPEKYDGILDEALITENIPVFFAKETSMMEFSLAKMILAAYACLDRGFARADLIGYMKCGFSGIPKEDCDLLELYAETWRLKAAAFAEDRPFDMHPDGYGEDTTEESASRLARINAAREALLRPLWEFGHTSARAKTAKEHIAALYRLLSELGAEKKLLADAAAEAARDRKTEAARLERLFPMLCDVLDRIADIMEDAPLSRERFAELLSLLFSAVPVYTVPTVMDAVTVADADTFRHTEESTLFLFGAIEGEFPASVSLNGVFSEEERRTLKENGVTVGKPPEVRASREQFSFLRGIASPKHAEVIAFEADAMGAACKPSGAFLRLAALFPEAPIATGEADVYSLRAARERFHDLSGTPTGDAVLPLLISEGLVTDAHTVPLFDPDCSVGEETAKALFPDEMTTSQSRINKFLDCPFAYYCQYALKLNALEAAAIRPVEVGNIVHKILEKFFAYLRAENTDIRSMDRARIPEYVERAVNEYAAEILSERGVASPRISHLLFRLRRAAVFVCEDLYEEFAASAFTPAFCELSLTEGDGPGALVFRDAEGRTVAIGGTIDRVDTFCDGDTLFVRVVDYKSSEHKFSREDLKKARNLQMFVYLCAIWKTKSEPFVKRLTDGKSVKILPAGIVYSTASPSLLSLSAPGDETTATAFSKKNLRRRGFFLAEQAVLRAMDDALPHMAYSVEKRGAKKGTYDTAKPKLFGSLVEFGEMLDDVEKAVLSTAGRMRSGCADIAPDKEADRCPDCPYRALCRIEGVKKKKF